MSKAVFVFSGIIKEWLAILSVHMSKFLYTNNHDQKYQLIIEQLEVCVDLIKSKSPNKARMAIILLDNLADALMLRYCNYKFSEDEFFGLYIKPKYTKKQLQRAENDIQGKVELLRNNTKGILTKKDEVVISVCHSYRNSAQHNDEHNPQTTTAIARVLFTTVSNLFAKVQHKGYSAYYAGSPIWAQNYSSDRKIVYKDLAAKIAKKLQKGITLSLPNLKNILVFDISSRTEKIDEMVADLPFKKAKDLSHMLKMFEYQRTDEYKALGANLYDAKYRMESNTITYHDGFLKSGAKDQDEALRRTYKPEVTYQTYLKVKTGYQTILKERDLHSVLRAYERFSRPLEALELLFEDASEQWRQWQDLLEDIARGK